MQIITKIFRPRRISLGLIISLSVFLMLIIPIFSSAQSSGLVPCNNNPAPTSYNQAVSQGVANNASTPCDFNAFMTLINTVIHFILFNLAIPIAAIMFFYAGFLMVTSGGNTESRGKAKNIFSNAVYGLIIATCAWLVIRTILSILGYQGAWIGF